jgi:hypothetical protein
MQPAVKKGSIIDQIITGMSDDDESDDDDNDGDNGDDE